MLTAFFLSMFLTSASPYADPILNDPHMAGIRSVTCVEPETNNIWVGTMFHVHSRTYMSAYHVADSAICFDSKTGSALSVSYGNFAKDYAIFKSDYDFDNVIFKLSCSIADNNKTYTAIGWPTPHSPAAVHITATGNYSPPNYKYSNGNPGGHLRLFKGALIPGMSGGLTVDENWTVYAINNAGNNTTAFQREISDTIVCL